MKDPRFSATLLVWLRVGCLPRDDLRIVRVTRQAAAAAASVMKHKEVREYCGNDIREALAMTETYDANAVATAELIGRPVCTIAYEALIADPLREVTRLADYVGVPDTARIRHASRLIGKRRALFAHYLRKAADPALLANTIAKTARARRLPSG